MSVTGIYNQEGKPETVIKQIYKFLKSKNIKVYMPAEHIGDCLEPYVVVRSGGVVELLSVSSERPVYTFMFYVPYRNYLQLEEFKEQVKEMLIELYPMIQYSGNETEAYYDDTNQSFMTSVEYYGIRKIRYIR